jgi:hypothetical protein
VASLCACQLVLILEILPNSKAAQEFHDALLFDRARINLHELLVNMKRIERAGSVCVLEVGKTSREHTAMVGLAQVSFTLLLSVLFPYSNL